LYKPRFTVGRGEKRGYSGRGVDGGCRRSGVSTKLEKQAGQNEENLTENEVVDLKKETGAGCRVFQEEIYERAAKKKWGTEGELEPRDRASCHGEPCS